MLSGCASTTPASKAEAGKSEAAKAVARSVAARDLTVLDVAGLSARGARVTLRYAEGAQRLAQELAQKGLSLRSDAGTWVLALR